MVGPVPLTKGLCSCVPSVSQSSGMMYRLVCRVADAP